MKRGVPNFWLYALKGHDLLAAQITVQDEEALKHLTDIKWSRIQKGFILEFHFNTNPFFENPVLAKTYHMNDEDEFFLESSIGTKITWRPGKCLTQKPSTNKSFFGLFSPPEIPMNLKDTKNTVVVTNLKYEMENDCFLGSIIRDEIIPRAISWFTGEAGLEQKTQISAQRSNFLKNLSEDVKECVESLRSIQETYDAFKAKFDKDRASIQAEYCQSCQPLYVERYKIINDEAYEESIDHEA
uniref:nucleosome assembly protein 1;1-like n=1 Tax=Fragaria vesca subsp. vesca TaxID=101020 RepID=UPI0005C99CCD|nr:PREDICTED: nucleosome assembly protein 1;1-like [Fragaria vesca subsp. vesca]